MKGVSDDLLHSFTMLKKAPDLKISHTRLNDNSFNGCSKSTTSEIVSIV